MAEHLEKIAKKGIENYYKRNKKVGHSKSNINNYPLEDSIDKLE